MSPEMDSLKPGDLKKRIERYRDSYEARFKRNQYTNNTIIGASIILTILIAISGTSPVFKDSQNPWANPLGVSAAAWLGLISTALLSVQKLYNVQEKIAFYPGYIVQAEELIEDLDAVKTEEDLQKIRDRFRKMRAEEATKRPIENSPS
ncbi:hypothetical protein [Nostoc sp. FACHB-857]|uniref:SMODS and SLOG-associating 2TM effector domain-containing protein n=2 Tax=Nostoc paludosum TaxID=212362 RepID=A0ABR8K234_9NOSO|nr:hypothetical protein [Nostoc sp. FACHB-857]MBD2676188.1 hypothetical protein [Nostoc sp. FACHB-857]MBD2732683.1 hypothetical protein [Nostoc paludosum FACHB-159]